MFKTLIVDDEPPARKEMRFLLREHLDFSVKWEAEGVADARRILSEVRPHVVFLDIQLRGGDGFELVPAIHEETDVVFVTAYDAYAVRAFEVNALDYLTKPVSPRRLKSTLDRLRKKASVNRIADRPLGKFEQDDKIFVSTTEGRMFLDCRKITAITAIGGNYTMIRTTSREEHLVRDTMKHWGKRLPQGHFLRAHRNLIINTDFIESLQKSGPRKYTIFLRDDESAYSVSRNMVQLIRKILENTNRRSWIEDDTPVIQ